MDNKRLDEAVQKALVEWYHPKHSFQPEAMRAALLASLPVLLGPVVAEWRKTAHHYRYNPAAMPFTAKNVERCADQLESVYAPSLGEGHE